MTKINNINRLKSTRKELRNNCTNAEQILWKYLQRSQLLGLKFRRQHSIGRYILDFYCPTIKLGIELDGSVHDNRQEYDRERTKFLESGGCTIIRYRNDQIEKQIAIMLDNLQKYIQANYDIK